MNVLYTAVATATGGRDGRAVSSDKLLDDGISGGRGRLSGAQRGERDCHSTRGTQAEAAQAMNDRVPRRTFFLMHETDFPSTEIA